MLLHLVAFNLLLCVTGQHTLLLLERCITVINMHVDRVVGDVYARIGM